MKTTGLTTGTTASEKLPVSPHAGFKAATANAVRAVSAAAVALALAASLSGCGSTASAGAATQAPGLESAAPATRYVGVVLDGTSSTDPAFVGDMRQLLTGKVANHIPALPADLRGGAQGADTLVVYIYMVGTDPLKYKGQNHYEVKVAGYQALPPRPSNTEAESYADDVAKWGTFRDDVWKPQYDAALKSQEEALALLAAVELSNGQSSGVFSTTSALARVLPAGSPVIVCSDLENNQNVALDGSLTGCKVYIVKPYTSGDVNYQHQLEDEYKKYLADMGVSEAMVEVYAPEQADAAFASVFGQ